MSNFTEQEFESYSQLILHLIEVKKGDLVLINTEFEHKPLVMPLIRNAYKLGAKFVQVQLSSEYMDGIRAEFSEEEYLSYFPASVVDLMREYNDNKACVISIRSPEAPHINTTVPSEKLSKINSIRRESLHFFHKSVLSDQFSWIVTAYPTKGWAEHVFPNLDKEQGSVQLWQEMKKILKLHSDNPVEAWKHHQSKMINRRNYMNKKQYKALHFVSEGTDFYVSLHEEGVWLGAAHTSKNGKYFQANLPTEEIYTSPDCRFTQGKVTVKRPLPIFGKKVEKITMTFKDGKIVESQAEVNNDVLQQYIEADERNRYLGEIALVGVESPIWQSELVFNSILYDENAGVHFAIGAAYPAGYGAAALDDKDQLKNKDELLSIGCNVSPYHLDFVIGSDDMNVYGVCANDTEETIMQDGTFIEAIDEPN